MSARARIRPGPIGASARRARGFTLIELLVALTLFGLISIVVMGGLRFGTRVWETGDSRAQAVAEVEAVQGILRRYLAQATLPQILGQLDEGSRFFVGEPDRVRFVTLSPAHVGIGGLYLVEIALVRGQAGEAGTLDLMWSLYRPDEALPDGPLVDEAVADQQETAVAGRRTLLTGVDSVIFSYYGSDSAAHGNVEMEETWQDMEGLPGLVALNIEFADGSGRFWPPLVIQTRLAHARH